MLYPVKGSISVNGATVNLDLEVAPGLLTAALAEFFGATPALPTTPIVQTPPALKPVSTEPPLESIESPTEQPPSTNTAQAVSIMSQALTTEEKIAMVLKIASEENFELFDRTLKYMLDKFVVWTERGIRNYIQITKMVTTIYQELVIRHVESKQKFDRKWIWQMAKLVVHNRLTLDEVMQIIQRYTPAQPEDRSPPVTEQEQSALISGSAPPPAGLKPFVFEEAGEPKDAPAVKPKGQKENVAKPVAELAGLKYNDVEELQRHSILTTEDLAQTSMSQLKEWFPTWARRTRVRDAANAAGVTIPGQRGQRKDGQVGRPRKSEVTLPPEEQLLDDQEPMRRLQEDQLVPAFAKLEDVVIPEVIFPNTDPNTDTSVE